MKLSTPIGATFGKRVQCRSPAVVWMMAVGSAAPEAACAAPSNDVEMVRTSMKIRVRIGAPGGILANVNCTTVNPRLLVESWRPRPAARLPQVRAGPFDFAQ